MHAVIFKNDAVGDLVPSLSAINNIIYSKKKYEGDSIFIGT